jgi:hypothetical protein
VIKRVALSLLFIAHVAIAAAYASAFLPGGAPPWSAWLVVLGTSLALPSVILLGAERAGRIGGLWIPIALCFVVLFAGFGAVLVMPPADPADPTLWLGLPPRAAILLYGIGLVPYLIVPVAYALTFESRTLGEADLERVREAAKVYRARTAAGEASR